VLVQSIVFVLYLVIGIPFMFIFKSMV
jgi:hypothetical protein